MKTRFRYPVITRCPRKLNLFIVRDSGHAKAVVGVFVHSEFCDQGVVPHGIQCRRIPTAITRPSEYRQKCGSDSNCADNY